MIDRITSLFFTTLFCAVFFTALPALANTTARDKPTKPFDLPQFTLHKMETGAGPTLLVIGGIQGDEPGGFSAATLLITHYTIHKGNLWVVPNLNYPSIITRSRGDHGDMNRKFDLLSPNDPEFDTISRIKTIITDPRINTVFNLHDGSGYYRPTYINPKECPQRWGQCVIIDQIDLKDVPFGNLEEKAKLAVEDANKLLLKPLHVYNVRNTKTGEGDVEMSKSLTWYALRNNKPAFGIEASKEFNTPLRSYYHLVVMESFLRQAGIEFTRNFELTPQGVEQALGNNLVIALGQNRIVLPLDDVRPQINFLPIPKENVSFTTTKPILTIIKENNSSLRVSYGNRTLTRIIPEWREYDDSLENVMFTIDGNEVSVPTGSTVTVEKTVKVHSREGYRVNIIGYNSKATSECNIEVSYKNFIPRFSLDKAGKLFRVEIYKDNKFAGMVLIRFGKPKASTANATQSLPSVQGPESLLGR